MVGPVRLNQDLRKLPYVPPKKEFDERRPDALSARDRRATKGGPLLAMVAKAD